MTWKNAAAASWKSFKSLMLLIWSLYDCEPTPEAIERKRVREAEWAAEVERHQRERCRRSMADEGVSDFVALICTGFVCACVLIGGAWIYSDYIAPHIPEATESVKSHIPVKVTIEYRTPAQEDSIKVEAYLRYLASQHVDTLGK